MFLLACRPSRWEAQFRAEETVRQVLLLRARHLFHFELLLDLPELVSLNLHERLLEPLGRSRDNLLWTQNYLPRSPSPGEEASNTS